MRSRARPGTTLYEPGSVAMSPIVATQPGKPVVTVSRTPRTKAAAPRAASLRASIGVVPACRASPSNTTLNEAEPMIPVTMPMSMPALLEHRTLLDVELEVAGERARVAARGEQAILLSPIRASSETSRSRPPRGAPRILGRQDAGHRPASQQADEGAFLVREVDRLERDGELEVGVLDGPQDLESAEDSQGAVVAAAAAHRVEVGAEQSVRAAGSRAGRTTEWWRGSTGVSSPAAASRSWNHARAARCGSENVVRATPPSASRRIRASASKSRACVRRRSTGRAGHPLL